MLFNIAKSRNIYFFQCMFVSKLKRALKIANAFNLYKDKMYFSSLENYSSLKFIWSNINYNLTKCSP